MSKSYFISGPSASATIHDMRYCEGLIAALCMMNGDDTDEYTCTEIDGRPSSRGEAVAEVEGTPYGKAVRFTDDFEKLPFGTKLYAAPGVVEGDALLAVAEEIESGHEWITKIAASAIIRKHLAKLTAAIGDQKS